MKRADDFKSHQVQLVSSETSCNRGLVDLVEQMYEIVCGPVDAGVRKEIAKRCDEIPSLDAWEYAFIAVAPHIHLRRWRTITTLALLIHRVFGGQDKNAAGHPLLSRVLLMYHDYISPHNPHIPPSILSEIKSLVEKIDDIERWEQAFKRAAEANALRWSYVRAVLLGNNTQGQNARPRYSPEPRRRLAAPTAEQSACAEQHAAALRKLLQ